MAKHHYLLPKNESLHWCNPEDGWGCRVSKSKKINSGANVSFVSLMYFSRLLLNLSQLLKLFTRVQSFWICLYQRLLFFYSTLLDFNLSVREKISWYVDIRFLVWFDMKIIDHIFTEWDKKFLKSTFKQLH